MLNNQCKISNYPAFGQILAGLKPSDNNIEFVALRETKQVIWLQNGSSHYFTDLPAKYFSLVMTIN